MRTTAIMIALIAVGIGAQPAFAQVPKLDVTPSCEAAARGAIILGRDKQACLGDENAARETLEKGWSKYNAADKTQCVGLARQGGPPSYVELLSCLEVMRDSKTVRTNSPLTGAPADTGATNLDRNRTTRPAPRPARRARGLKPRKRARTSCARRISLPPGDLACGAGRDGVVIALPIMNNARDAARGEDS